MIYKAQLLQEVNLFNQYSNNNISTTTTTTSLLLNEVNILKKLKHDNIIRLYR